ncbi:MAG TPA: hypothetical protein VMU85_00715, partial [Stellaceae bacterium]|nr:hypothetical protein [Stellaceae bacterium]
MAEGDLTSLANVKAWFAPPLAATTDDALLQRLITAASGFILTWLDRDLAEQSYSEIRDGTGGRRLALANTPVTAVAALAIDGVAIPPMPDATSPGYGFTAT